MCVCKEITRWLQIGNRLTLFWLWDAKPYRINRCESSDQKPIFLDVTWFEFYKNIKNRLGELREQTNQCDLLVCLVTHIKMTCARYMNPRGIGQRYIKGISQKCPFIENFGKSPLSGEGGPPFIRRAKLGGKFLGFIWGFPGKFQGFWEFSQVFRRKFADFQV